MIKSDWTIKNEPKNQITVVFVVWLSTVFCYMLAVAWTSG